MSPYDNQLHKSLQWCESQISEWQWRKSESVASLVIFLAYGAFILFLAIRAEVRAFYVVGAACCIIAALDLRVIYLSNIALAGTKRFKEQLARCLKDPENANFYLSNSD